MSIELTFNILIGCYIATNKKYASLFLLGVSLSTEKFPFLILKIIEKQFHVIFCTVFFKIDVKKRMGTFFMIIHTIKCSGACNMIHCIFKGSPHNIKKIINYV